MPKRNSEQGEVMDLSVCIINWNTKDLLEDCLHSIYSDTHSIDFEIFVVDNASNDDSPKMVKEKFPQVRLIENDTNLGFAKAFNKALQTSRGRYLLSLHPDTIVTRGALEGLVKFMDDRPEVGAVGAKLTYPDGSINRSCFHFPNLATEFYKCLWLNKIFQKSRIFGWYEMSYWDHGSVREVDWLSSSCLMARKETIDQVGALDENYFVWTADVDWCYQAKKRGWKIYYMPKSIIVHHERRANRGLKSPNPETAYKEKMYRVDTTVCLSTLYFFKKFYGEAAAGILRWVMVLEHINKIGFCIASLPFWGERRGELKERLRAYFKTLSALRHPYCQRDA